MWNWVLDANHQTTGPECIATKELVGFKVGMNDFQNYNCCNNGFGYILLLSVLEIYWFVVSLSKYVFLIYFFQHP